MHTLLQKEQSASSSFSSGPMQSRTIESIENRTEQVEENLRTLSETNPAFQSSESGKQSETGFAPDESCECFEDYVCIKPLEIGVRLFFTVIILLPLYGILTAILLSNGWGWFSVLGVGAALAFNYFAVGLISSRIQKRKRDNLRMDLRATEIQLDYQTARRNDTDTLRLGNKYLFYRGGATGNLFIQYPSGHDGIRKFKYVYTVGGCDGADQPAHHDVSSLPA